MSGSRIAFWINSCVILRKLSWPLLFCKYLTDSILVWYHYTTETMNRCRVDGLVFLAECPVLQQDWWCSLIYFFATLYHQLVMFSCFIPVHNKHSCKSTGVKVNLIGSFILESNLHPVIHWPLILEVGMATEFQMVTHVLSTETYLPAMLSKHVLSKV